MTAADGVAVAAVLSAEEAAVEAAAVLSEAEPAVLAFFVSSLSAAVPAESDVDSAEAAAPTSASFSSDVEFSSVCAADADGDVVSVAVSADTVCTVASALTGITDSVSATASSQASTRPDK